MVRCGGGLASGPDLLHAAHAAAAEARAALGEATPDLACVFVTGDDHALVEAALLVAAEHAGAAATVGCSAYGVLGPGRAAEAIEPDGMNWKLTEPNTHRNEFHKLSQNVSSWSRRA